MSKEIEEKVAAIMESSGVTMTTTLRGETKLDGWVCDEWAVTFTLNPEASITLPYFCGVGHRQRTLEQEQRFRRALGPNPPSTRSLMYESISKAHPAKPQPPSPAGVLHSLVMDSYAEGMTFDDWCSDYGYSNDSIKALGTFHACIESGRKLRAIFRRPALEELREVLQDY